MPQPLSCQYGKQQCYIRMDLYESTGVVGDAQWPPLSRVSELNYEINLTAGRALAI